MKRHCRPQSIPAYLHSPNPLRDPPGAGRRAWGSEKGQEPPPGAQTGSSERQKLKGTNYILQHGRVSETVPGAEDADTEQNPPHDPACPTFRNRHQGSG